MLVKIQAKNSEGWSDASKWSDSVRFPSVPSQLQQLEVIETTGSTITLRWEKFPGTAHYILYEGTNEHKTEENQLELTDLVQGTSYTFRVRAFNACGGSPTSDPVTDKTPTKQPGRIPEVTTSIDGCFLMMKWSEPNDGGSRIYDYKI